MQRPEIAVDLVGVRGATLANAPAIVVIGDRVTGVDGAVRPIWAALSAISATIAVLVAFDGYVAGPILLTAPITWTSNLVWLAPLVPLILFGPAAPPRARHVRAAAMFGLVLLILPDALKPGLLVASPRARELLGAQYVLALLLVLPYALVVARGGVKS